MSRSTEVPSLEYVARQAGRLIGRGESLEGALQRLTQESPESMRAAVETLKQSLGTEGAIAPGRLGTLQRLLAGVRAAGGRVDQTVVQFLRSADALGDAIQETAQGLRNSLAYSYGLLAVLLIVMGIAQIFMIPSLGVLYSSMGARLPPLTSVLFTQGWVFPVIALLLALGCWSLFRCAQALSRSARDLTPVRAGMRRWPWMKRLAGAVDDLLAVQYLSALQAGGLGQATGRAHLNTFSTEHRPQLSEELDQELQTADRLGLATEELQTQIEIRSQHVALAADVVGRRLSLTLRVFLFASIALYVIALYQPIFQLGSTL